MSKMTRLTGFFCAALLVGGAMPSFAVDGVVLIDQNRALAGNVTPGDGPGFPVIISVPGSYRLASNLSAADPNVRVIEIIADDVSLDLNGFAIRGPVTCSGTPLVCSPSNVGGIGVISFGTNTTVRNGEISGMGFAGVVMAGGEESTIDHLHVRNNGQAGISMQNGTVSNCHVSNNGGWGISLNMPGGLVLNNTARGNSGEGIAAVPGTGYSGNVLTGNTGFGGQQVFGAINLGHNLCGTTLCP